MAAGIAELLGNSREYYLFDSFEGLPPAAELDGPQAKRWQADKSAPTYFDNCRAPIDFASRAMEMSGVANYHLEKGWFKETLLGFKPSAPIAILRIDGDWYESTLTVLESLFHQLAPGGIAIVDDYYAWDGCSRAVHEYLARHQSTTRLKQEFGICVLEPRQESLPASSEIG